MIYIITKYHETSSGKTASSEVIKNANSVKAEREAQQKFRQLGANYMADESVKTWRTMLIDPLMNTVIDKDGYSEPAVAVEEQPTDVMPE